MASFLKSILGGDKKSAQAPLDDGFADFAGAPDPSPEQVPPSPASLGGLFASKPAATLAPSIPYTKWYRVWERTSPRDFMQEATILPFLLLVLGFHLWGLKTNKRKARDWAKHHIPAINFEYAQVGFKGPKDIRTEGDIEDVLVQNTSSEWVTYATGRQNVAFVDFRLTFTKRYNPLIMLGENLLGLIFEAIPPTVERMEATAYVFDNKEGDYVPKRKDDPPIKSGNSSYDGFVWAVVHKRMLKQLRDERYDLSLTSTKDHAKLPPWTTVLTESAEITDTLLTNDLIKTIEDAGELFDALVITDQPLDQPFKLQDTVPKKRLSLSIRLPSSSVTYVNTLPLFARFLRLPDFLVQSAKFRPEVLRKVKQTREAEINKIKKKDDEEKAEERKLQQDKDKKEKRDALLKSMSADEQRKFLEKEREKGSRKAQKRRTMRA